MAPCENNYSLAKNCDERKIFVNKVLMLYPGQILQQKLKKKMNCNIASNCQWNFIT